MSNTNENISKNGWSEYGRLVLAELQRLNQGQDAMKKDLDSKFIELNNKISAFNALEKEIEELNTWKKDTLEVWSASQMKQAKDEIYKQKGYYQRVTGIIIAIQILLTLFMAVKDKIF